jgi:hypothetical protein
MRRYILLNRTVVASLRDWVDWQDCDTANKRLRHLARRKVQSDLREAKALAAWAYVGLIVMAVGAAVPAFSLVPRPFAPETPAAISLIGGFFFAYGVLIVTLVMRSKWQLRLPWIQSFLLAVTAILLVSWALGSAFSTRQFYLRYIDGSASMGTVVSAGVATGVTIVLGLAIAVFFWGLPIPWIRQLAQGYNSADAALLYQLANVGKWLMEDTSAYHDLDGRRDVVKHLENAAQLTEVNLARAMLLPAPESNSVLQARLRRAARQIREYQLWIMLPNSQTRKDLLSTIARMLAAVLLSEYDALPSDPSLDDDRPTRSRVRAIATQVWVAVVGLVPLAGLITARHYGFTFPKPIDGAALVVAALWAFTSLLMLIDPMFNARLAAVKELAQLFKGPNNEGAKKG